MPVTRVPSIELARKAAIAIVVIGGGLLQAAYTNTSHPSIMLQIWEVVYGVLGTIWLVYVATLGVRYIKRRLHRGSVSAER